MQSQKFHKIPAKAKKDVYPKAIKNRTEIFL